jgi:predicted nucleotide-binding protein
MTMKDEADLQRKRANLTHLLRQLAEQDEIIRSLIPRSASSQGASESLMRVLRDLFQHASDALPEKQISFDDNNDLDGLRAQISSLRAKAVAALIDIGGNPPQQLRENMPSNENESIPDPRKVFIVYGRNNAFRSAMFTFLWAIGLEPMEWGQVLRTAVQSSPFIGDALDHAFPQAKATIVLLSGDDLARLGKAFLQPHDNNDERELTPQARPNVLFEAGMAFGRSPQNVVLVSIGYVRPFSDIAGRHVLHMNDSVAARQDLAERLEHAGCAVDTKGKTEWHKAGDFASALIEPDPSLPNTPLLEVVRRRADPQVNAGYKPKVWTEVRNNSKRCLEIRILGWKQTPMGVKIKYGPSSMQLKIGHVWCPEKDGVEILYVGPTNKIQAWLQPDADPQDATAMAELHKRCETSGQIGQLELHVDGVPVLLDI